MTGTLVIGLGNPLAGDDGAGWFAAECLRRDPRLPPGVTVIQGGTDLLRLRHHFATRRRVFILDALLDPGPAGRLLVFEDLDTLDEHAGSVHHCSPTHALRLLRSVYSEITDVPVVFLCITIHSVRIGAPLSHELATHMPDIVDQTLATLASPPDSRPSGMR